MNAQFVLPSTAVGNGLKPAVPLPAAKRTPVSQWERVARSTVELEAQANAPIATVNLPVTGGWQTWTTVNAPVIGASGMHTLYVVFNGSTPSIANVNWFQFQ